MVYNWEINEFSEQIKKLQEIVESETDIKRKTYLQKVSDVTDKLYYDLFGDLERPKQSIKQRLTEILESRITYGRYYSIVNCFFDECYRHIEFIDRMTTRLEGLVDEDDDFPFLQTGASFSDEKILCLVDEFYRTFDSDLYQKFLNVYNDRVGTLRILDESCRPDNKSDGNTLFIDGVLKNFITIYRTTDVETFECSVHEYGHAIQNISNPQVSYSSRDDFFMEVASIFPELVALYEGNNELDELKLAYYLYTLVVTYIDKSEQLTLHTPVVNSWAESKYRVGKKFTNDMKTNFDIDEECLEEILSTTIEDDGVYVISFIVSLELFHIYKQDKKRALELFKKFLNFPANEDILVFVRENFELSNSASEEVGVILENFDKKLTKRGF